MPPIFKAVAHAGILVAVAAVLGLASNALRSDGLPLVRKPLSETRAVVAHEQLMADVPQRTSNPTPNDVPPGAKTASVSAVPVMPVEPSAPAKPKAEVTKGVAPVKPPTQEAKKPDPAVTKIQALFTNLKDAKSCFDNKNAVFLDSRAVEDYEAEHIAGALWLGYESVEEDYQKVLGKIPKDRLLVTYCSDVQCSSAIKLADALVALGHTRVVIMLEGLPGWRDAGYPTSSEMKGGE